MTTQLLKLLNIVFRYRKVMKNIQQFENLKKNYQLIIVTTSF